MLVFSEASKYLLIAFSLINTIPTPLLVKAAIITVVPGDDLPCKIANAVSGDTVKISAGIYSGAIDSISCSGKQDSCPQHVYGDIGGVTIIGMGSTPMDTQVIDIDLNYCGGLLLLQNFAMIGTKLRGKTTVIELDNSNTIIFRNMILRATSNSITTVVDWMAQPTAFFSSSIIGYGKATSSVGVNNGCCDNLWLMNTIISDFDVGFKDGYGAGADIVMSGCTLSNNNHACGDGDVYSVPGGYIGSGNKFAIGDASCGTFAEPNTQVVKTATTIPLNEIRSGNPNVLIKVTSITIKGQTTVYQLPTAYPAAPVATLQVLSLTPSQEANPPYYQFDSTATFGANPIIYFSKAVIDSIFPSNSIPSGKKITICALVANSWKLVTTSVVTVNNQQYYSGTWPNKILGLAALFVK